MKKDRRIDWKAKLTDLLKEYRPIAKRSNQRMLRLERYADPKNKMYRPEAKDALKFAYRKAQSAIHALLGPDKKRFKENIKVPESNKAARDRYYKVQALLRSLQEFDTSSSSTLNPLRDEEGRIIKEGLRDVLDRRSQTIYDNYIKPFGGDDPLTPEDLSKFFASRKFEKFKDKVGSTQMFIVAAEIKKIPTSKADIKEYLKDHIDIDNLSADDIREYKDILNDNNLNDIDQINKIDELRKFFNFVEFTDSEILNDIISDSLKNRFNAKTIFL